MFPPFPNTLRNILDSLRRGKKKKFFGGPSDDVMLFMGVPPEEKSLTVLRSVGENSGSLMGPLGANGVKMSAGDWSMPRFWRYNWQRKTGHVIDFFLRCSDVSYFHANENNRRPFSWPSFLLFFFDSSLNEATVFSKSFHFVKTPRI